jgi:putative ABC transport system permease protein
MSHMESLRQDIRYGLRMLARSPGFAVLAVMILALGIGANTAILSILNALVLRELPVRRPERLVQLTLLVRANNPGAVMRDAENATTD